MGYYYNYARLANPHFSFKYSKPLFFPINFQSLKSIDLGDRLQISALTSGKLINLYST